MINKNINNNLINDYIINFKYNKIIRKYNIIILKFGNKIFNNIEKDEYEDIYKTEIKKINSNENNNKNALLKEKEILINLEKDNLNNIFIKNQKNKLHIK